MTFLFLMDPLETVIKEKDTSFILMYESFSRQHRVHFVPDGGISIKNGKVEFNTTLVIPKKDEDGPFIVVTDDVLNEDQVDAVFIRNDPPFDQQYLMNTWLLDRLPKKVFVMNTPQGIRTVNEKIWATQFTELVPHTCVSSREDVLLNFLQEEIHVVVKPTDGFGGTDIFILKQGDQNTETLLARMTDTWQKEIIMQKFVPESKDGDKRILLLDGEPLGAVLRVHGKDSHLNNFFAGGTPEATEITKREHEIIDVLKPHLKNLGLYFVGIDVMGDYLIEVNVTSPTCLQEMNRLYDLKLEERVIDFVEKFVDRLQDTGSR